MSTIRATTLSNLAGSQTISTDRVAQGTAAAWVNFNGTGTVAIRASYNVSSITDNGTGDYTVNFTTALADANYGFALSLERAGGNTGASIFVNEAVAPTASTIRVIAVNQVPQLTDSARIGVAIFR